MPTSMNQLFFRCADSQKGECLTLNTSAHEHRDIDFRLLKRSGAITGPYTKPLLPELGRALREERWPLPIAIRSLKLRELAVLERRAMDNEKKRRGILCLFGF